MTFSSILLGIFIMFVSFQMISKTEWLVRNFGRIAFFDKYMGLSGGTRLGYKIIGTLAFAIGFFIATGLIDSILAVVTAPLVRHSLPK